ncbi:Pga4 predicted GPI-anchored cell surface protein [Candida orthopsilosis Co 90-125]|uniref:1,3-beta-glucanosyltransferase n=1 Tax=Candida orthopsilosis (strain 90-125) TaxID=1136231 RepID=H8X8V3_CANO9|nr:Pga4 predicted GPI-anchored cell surface protein [Candida orthopsilosis Co 90-125]CCG24251.1 Pga4 predicted GPI-anchored cell surface protein [Candida orthopsilosis Co 90-125]
MLFKSILTYISLVTAALAIPAIEVRGNAFWNTETNERFYIRGVDYQPGGSSELEDPLADTDVCERDIPYFQELGINTVRVYSVDNTKDHDECMDRLAEAGIYVILDVNTPHSSITRSNAECSYNSDYLQEVFASAQLFAQYNNTLGFFAGNEVINDGASLDAAPYVKAVVRDLKTFIKNRGFRTIPVGYSAASVDEYRLSSGLYFNCGDDELARIDMYGINDYSWCGDASMTTSQYSQELKDFKNFTVPLFFSEFGCNAKKPRPFSEIESIYSTDMSSVFSGGLVYEYSEEDNEYGLVKLDGDDVTPNQDFKNLKNEFNKTENPSGDGGYLKSSGGNNCPSKSSLWNVTEEIPDTPGGAIKYVKGLAEPTGHGFDAYVQGNCNGNNDVDDSGNYTSTIGASTHSAASTATTAQSSSASSSVSSSSSTSSGSKENEGVVVAATSVTSVVGLLALIAGFIAV